MAFTKMKNQREFLPYEIIFSVTDFCNLKCKHCYIQKNNKVLDVSAAKKFLDTINKCKTESEITHIGFSGGEPFLFPDVIEQIVKKSIEKDLLFDCIMTNGLWWKSLEELKTVLQKIYDAGFDGKIGISIDYYHAQAFSNDFALYFQKLSEFCQSIFDIWQDSSMIKIQTVNYKTENQIFNKKKIIQSLPDCFEYEIFCFDESFTSDDERAWKDKKWFKEDYCFGPGQILYVHSDGRIAPCCGFANENEKLIIGNLNQTFDEILKNAKNNEMINLCYTKGLSSKIKELKKQKLLPKGKTKDNCTFCDFICNLK